MSTTILSGNALPSAFTLFIVQVVFILALSKGMGYILKPLKQPSVVGEMIAGILLGPTALGRIPGFSATLFPPASVTVIQVIANFALIFFMFIVGLELDPKKLRSDGKLSLAISACGIAVPCIASILLALYFRDPAYSNTSFLNLCCFLTVALGMSALPVLARIISERRLLATRLGSLVMTVAAVDDVLGWILLAITIALIQSDSALGVLYTLLVSVGDLLFMYYVIGPLIRFLVRREEGRTALSTDTFLALTLVLVTCSYIAEVIGLSSLIGAFMVGLLIPRSSQLSALLSEKLESFTVVILMPLFFTNSGLRTQFGLINDGQTAGVAILVIVVATVSKILGIVIPSTLMKIPVRMGVLIGVLMSCKGLVALIVVNMAYSVNIITDKFFAILVLMVLVTTVATVPLMQLVSPSGKMRPSDYDAMLGGSFLGASAAASAASTATSSASTSAAEGSDASSVKSGSELVPLTSGNGLQSTDEAFDTDRRSEDSSPITTDDNSSANKEATVVHVQSRADEDATASASGPSSSGSGGGAISENIVISTSSSHYIRDSKGDDVTTGRCASCEDSVAVMDDLLPERQPQMAVWEGEEATNERRDFIAPEDSSSGGSGRASGGTPPLRSATVQRPRSLDLQSQRLSAPTQETARSTTSSDVELRGGGAETDRGSVRRPSFTDSAPSSATSAASGGGFGGILRSISSHFTSRTRAPTGSTALHQLGSASVTPVLGSTTFQSGQTVGAPRSAVPSLDLSPTAASSASVGNQPPSGRLSSRNLTGHSEFNAAQQGQGHAEVVCVPDDELLPPPAEAEAVQLAREHGGKDLSSDGAAPTPSKTANIRPRKHAKPPHHPVISLGLAISETSPAPSLVTIANMLHPAAALEPGGAAFPGARLTLVWLLESMDMPSSYMNVANTVADIRDATLSAALSHSRLHEKSIEVVTFPSAGPLDDATDVAQSRKFDVLLMSSRLLKKTEFISSALAVDTISAQLRKVVLMQRPCVTAVLFDFGLHFGTPRILCPVLEGARLADPALWFLEKTAPDAELGFLHVGRGTRPTSTMMGAAVGAAATSTATTVTTSGLGGVASPPSHGLARSVSLMGWSREDGSQLAANGFVLEPPQQQQQQQQPHLPNDQAALPSLKLYRSPADGFLKEVAGSLRATHVMSGDAAHSPPMPHVTGDGAVTAAAAGGGGVGATSSTTSGSGAGGDMSGHSIGPVAPATLPPLALHPPLAASRRRAITFAVATLPTVIEGLHGSDSNVSLVDMANSGSPSPTLISRRSQEVSTLSLDAQSSLEAPPMMPPEGEAAAAAAGASMTEQQQQQQHREADTSVGQRESASEALTPSLALDVPVPIISSKSGGSSRGPPSYSAMATAATLSPSLHPISGSNSAIQTTASPGSAAKVKFRFSASESSIVSAASAAAASPSAPSSPSATSASTRMLGSPPPSPLTARGDGGTSSTESSPRKTQQQQQQQQQGAAAAPPSPSLDARAPSRSTPLPSTGGGSSRSRSAAAAAVAATAAATLSELLARPLARELASSQPGSSGADIAAAVRSILQGSWHAFSLVLLGAQHDAPPDASDAEVAAAVEAVLGRLTPVLLLCSALRVPVLVVLPSSSSSSSNNYNA